MKFEKRRMERHLLVWREEGKGLEFKEEVGEAETRIERRQRVENFFRMSDFETGST